MHPILFKIGPITIYSYGLFIASAVFLAFGVIMKEARRKNLDPKIASDLGFYVIIMGIIGSRLGYVIIAPKEFIEDPLLIIKIWKGGLVFLSGFILAFVFCILFLRKKKQPIWEWLDTFAFGLPLGQFVGRIGCFMAGCCYGKVCNYPWAVKFHDPFSLAPINVPLHPTELYHSLAGLLTFLILLFSRKKLRRGQTFLLLVILYSLFRFTIEFYRGDPRPYLGPLSITQWLCVPMFILSCIGFIKLYKDI